MSLPLSIRLQPSARAAAALAMIHGLAIVAIASSRLMPALSIGLSCPVVLSCLVALRRHALHRAPRAIVSCTLRSDGEIEALRRDGSSMSASVEPSSTVFHWLVVLQLRDGKHAESLILLPDMMDPEMWRRLGVALRVRATEAQGRQRK